MQLGQHKIVVEVTQVFCSVERALVKCSAHGRSFIITTAACSGKANYCQHNSAPVLYSVLAQPPKRHMDFWVYSFSNTGLTCMVCRIVHAQLDRCYCFWLLATTLTDASDNFTCQEVDPEIAVLYSMSHCRHCQWNWETEHSTASSNHCFMISSFWEWPGIKLAAHWHHGWAPAASWFQVDVSKRPFVVGLLLRYFRDLLVA